ncbi:hypothetical protein JCGZ_05788 [Jatropha curcas]|uniref:Uncharacterized protein n=1 Tax=Jatropha curcas TaxID=180498 RepID=A0A067J9Q2_JATCU|nr:hypothetical protein JCGZ_05788 [Jatropha curcas]
MGHQLTAAAGTNGGDDGGGDGDIRKINPRETMAGDQGFPNIINNNNYNLAASSSAKNGMMNHHPYSYNITHSGVDMEFPT